MSTKIQLAAAVLGCLAWSTAPAYATAASSAVHGVIQGTDGVPLPQARVIVRNQKNDRVQSVTSALDGTFLVANLKPGLYQLNASKDGFLTSSAAVQLKAHENLQVALALPPENSAARNAGLGKPGSPSPTEREAELLDRIERLEERLATMEAQDANLAQPNEKPVLRAESLPAPPAPSGAAPAAAALPPDSGPAAAPAAQTGSRQSAPVVPPAPVAPAEPILPDALQAPESSTGVDNITPFAYGDFTWLNGNPRTKVAVLDTKFFTPEIRFDSHYMEDFNQPIDHTIVGSTESFRSGEVQVEQISFGGDFHWQNVRGRVLTMFGLFATTTPRNDASAGVGQWDLRDAYRYVSEAYGGYHFNVNHGLNVDAGIFVSYIGLFSYYNFDNWTYQPSYVSSNTPWFFNGVRVQWFPTNKLKIEPWFINGWQSYAKYNGHPGLGGQILYRPKEWLSLVFNQYGFGEDNLGLPHTERIHTDDSIEVRYFNKPDNKRISKMGFSLTGDAGCEYGGGLSCTHGAGSQREAFLGWMLYNRVWFDRDLYAITLGGGKMSNPGRYLTLLPPIDGADAVSGTPYFTENPGQPAHMWDSTVTLQWMPKQYITWWLEFGYRHSDVPYFAGRGGVTPPGGNNGSPQYYTCMTGATAGTADLGQAYSACGGPGSVWFPDLRHSESKLSAGVMVKF